MNYSAIHLPPYDSPPLWVPPHERIINPDYLTDYQIFVPRRTTIRREDLEGPLGINIIGGKDRLLGGVYVSKVVPNSPASFGGLKEGDKILKVNDHDFTDIDHQSAVNILRGNLILDVLVCYFPYGYETTQYRLRNHRF